MQRSISYDVHLEQRAAAPREDNTPLEPNYGRSVVVGVVLGLITGSILGIAMLWYIGSPQLYLWPRAASWIALSAFGWALSGMIVGSGGIFSDAGGRNSG
jgi:hypothetical protein